MHVFNTSMAFANWTVVAKDPDLSGYTHELLVKMSEQLHRAERDDPTTIVVLVASIFVLVFSVCFAVASCALRCCLRRWTRLLDEPPPSADEPMASTRDEGDGDGDEGDDGDDGEGRATAGSGRERGVELD